MLDLRGGGQTLDVQWGVCYLLWHFIDFVKPTKEETVVLILDSHVTHTKNLAATDMAQEAGVVMVSLPPHTTHRFQPLDGPFSDRLEMVHWGCRWGDVDERTYRQTSDNMASHWNS